MDPLGPQTVELVLRYLTPLGDPLPPHLVSAPLRQRHRLLQISPSSPREYLCWPDPDNPSVVDLLDRLPPLPDLPTFPIRYTSDAESTFAHAQISSEGLRMLFHWDHTDGWGYHDLRLMPFPSSSYSTPQEALAATSPPDAAHDHDHDPYWDAYGAAEHDPASLLPPDAAEGEDAYWAQYASVQGSADSTVPSPLPVNREPRRVDPADDGLTLSFPSQSHQILDIPIDAIHLRHSNSKLRPPSPDTLAHLLSTISPRKDVFSLVNEPDASHSLPPCSIDPSPEQTTADPDLLTPPMPGASLDPSLVSPVAFELSGVPLPECPARSEPEDTALTHSIKGLYYLWRVGRKGEPDENDRSAFLRIVQAAIAHE